MESAEFVPIAEAKQLKLQHIPAASLFVDGDQIRLRQVVWNLLSNAVKFTPAGGRVDVTLKVDDGQAVLNVSDTGKGISREFLPHLFHRFTQEHTGTSRSYMGLGIGMAISSSIIQLHSGNITAYSAGEEKGATITVKIPLLGRQQGPEKSPSDGRALQASQSLMGIKVLVVDDDADVRELVAAMLQLKGAEVAVASATSEALEIWQRFLPSVLIGDIGMPGDDGCVLIQKLRAIEQCDHRTPMLAIALTGYAQPEDAERARVAGYDIHVAKPVEPDMLVRAVAKLQKPIS